MPLKVSASLTFARVAKKLHAEDKKTLDQAVKKIAADPTLGEEKRGDLSGVFVYIFKLNKQETSMAHELMPNKAAPDELVLLGLGSRENFYAQLKR
jgi:hypothetical protein